MSELPVGWCQTRLGEITNLIQYGYTASSGYDIKGPRFLRITDIQNGKVDWSKVPSCEISPRDLTRYNLAPGDIVFARSGATTGKSFLIRACPTGAVFASYLIRVRANDEVVGHSFLAWFFQTPAYWEHISESMSGIAQPNCNGTKLAELSVPLAPLPEQKRIADKLDALLARVDACRERLDRVPSILKRFRQSVLAAATSGDLTREWRDARGKKPGTQEFEFEDADIFRGYTFPASWLQVRLSDVAEITGGITKDSKKQSTEFVELPYLRVANVQRGFLDLSEMKTIRVHPERIDDLLLKEGDILFNEGGDIDKLGRGWIWKGELSKCIFQNHVFRGRLRDGSFEPRYFSWYGNSRGYSYFLARGKQTTNLASINKSVLSALPVAVPPADEQREIVRRVNELFQFVEQLERASMLAANRVGTLTASTLAKAFRGELVPQDPNEEPAADLLARLRGRQAEAQSTSKPKRAKAGM